jgi:hypothetical protein
MITTTMWNLHFNKLRDSKCFKQISKFIRLKPLQVIKIKPEKVDIMIWKD